MTVFQIATPALKSFAQWIYTEHDVNIPPEQSFKAPRPIASLRGGGSVLRILLVTALSLLTSACDTGSVLEPAEVHVQVFQDGACAVEHISAPCGELGSRLPELCAQKECRVLLDADAHAPFDVVGQVLYSIQRSGIVNVQFAHRRPGA
jgi:biopolymer transport protein ExbD